MNHENTWDALFIDVLAGVVPYESSQVEALRRDDPQAARQLELLLALQGGVEGHFGQPESLQPSADDLRQVDDVLARLAGEHQPATGQLPDRTENPASSASPRHPAAESRAPFPSWFRVAAAVLALLAAGWWWSGTDRLEPPKDPLLLGETTLVEALAPLGTVDDFTVFEAAPPPGSLGRCELKIWDLATPATEPPLRTVLLREPRWRPSPDERRSLPTALHWQLILYDAQDRLLGVARGEARRRDSK